MDKSLIPHSDAGNTTRIERFQSLQAGEFWRVTSEFSSDRNHYVFPLDQVLLIKSIKWVENQPHTIVLHPHPSLVGKTTRTEVIGEDGETRIYHTQHDEYMLLLNEFLSHFEYEPNYERFRKEEIDKVQSRIDALQIELATTPADPEKMNAIIEKGLADLEEKKAASQKKDASEKSTLPVKTVLSHDEIQQATSKATGSLVSVLNDNLNSDSIDAMKQVAERQFDVANIKAKWIESKTSEIASTINELMPYYKERAVASMAATEDVRSYVDELMNGIQSLDLYVGNDVEVETIKEGESAARDVPLTFVQQKLLMDEEFSVHATVTKRFDFTNEPAFFDELAKNEELVNQIFPTARCVLVMAVTRRYIDYECKFANMKNNLENRKVFLLVRDGDNIHRVFSPITSHLGANKLFPSKTEQGELFKGFRGEEITLDDVGYSRADEQRKAFALHYKRFLILACGLDHRLKLFGDFYDGQADLSFISLAFQEKYCRFLHDLDGEGLLAGESIKSMDSWIREKNSCLTSGSRVAVICNEIISPKITPGISTENGRSSLFDISYHPEHTFLIEKVSKHKEHLVMKMPVSGYSYDADNHRRFNARVYIDLVGYHLGESRYLCLDAVKADELEAYINNRKARVHHLNYIQLFKKVLAYLREEEASQAPQRDHLLAEMSEAKLPNPERHEAVIDEAIIKWRADNKGELIPSAQSNSAGWKRLLNMVFALLDSPEEQVTKLKEKLEKSGEEVIRISIDAKGQYCAYTKTPIEQMDNRFELHDWVERTVYQKGQRDFVKKSSSQVLLTENPAKEVVYFNSDNASYWLRKSRFESPKKKAELLDDIETKLSMYAPLLKGESLSDETIRDVMNEWLDEREKISRNHVTEPDVFVPIGLVSSYHGMEFVGFSVKCLPGMLYESTSSEELREWIMSSYIKDYANISVGAEYMASEILAAKEHRTLNLGFVDAIKLNSIYLNNDVYFNGGKNRFAGVSWDRTLFHELNIKQDKPIWFASQLMTDKGISLDNFFGNAGDVMLNVKLTDIIQKIDEDSESPFASIVRIHPFFQEAGLDSVLSYNDILSYKERYEGSDSILNSTREHFNISGGLSARHSKKNLTSVEAMQEEVTRLERKGYTLVGKESPLYTDKQLTYVRMENDRH